MIGLRDLMLLDKYKVPYYITIKPIVEKSEFDGVCYPAWVPEGLFHLKLRIADIIYDDILLIYEYMRMHNIPYYEMKFGAKSYTGSSISNSYRRIDTPSCLEYFRMVHNYYLKSNITSKINCLNFYNIEFIDGVVYEARAMLEQVAKLSCNICVRSWEISDSNITPITYPEYIKRKDGLIVHNNLYNLDARAVRVIPDVDLSNASDIQVNRRGTFLDVISSLGGASIDLESRLLGFITYLSVRNPDVCDTLYDIQVEEIMSKIAGGDMQSYVHPEIEEITDVYTSDKADNKILRTPLGDIVLLTCRGSELVRHKNELKNNLLGSNCDYVSRIDITKGVLNIDVAVNIEDTNIDIPLAFASFPWYKPTLVAGIYCITLREQSLIIPKKMYDNIVANINFKLPKSLNTKLEVCS